MSSDGLKTPVVFLIFNRPTTTRKVFEAIAAARPAQLLVVADGPRASKPDDAALCRETREIAQNITWPCELRTHFAEANLGNCERIVSGLNWAFSEVEEAIILEDDCLPDPSFFPFCHELLDRFRGDSRIAMISGDNFTRVPLETGYSYYFSQVTHIWGWATWRRSWSRYDRYLKDWLEIKRTNLLGEVFDDPRLVKYWVSRFDEMYAKPNTWDYQWMYTNLIHHTLAVAPKVNMVTNIGFGPDATHTVDEDSNMILPSHPLEWPLRHPPSLLPMRSMDRLSQRLVLPPPLIKRAMGRLRRQMRSVK